MATSYTHMKLTDVKDSAPDFGFSDQGELRFGREAFDAEDTGFTYQRLNANVNPGFGHRHQKAEEVYVVLAGSGRLKLDDEIIEIGRLDAIRVAPAVTRCFASGPDGLEVLAFGPHHDSDGEVFPQWWTE